MRVVRTLVAVAVLTVPIPGWAQDTGQVPPQAAALNDLACLPFLIFAPPNDGLRVVGSQATVDKKMMGPGDTIVIDAGREDGILSGMEFYVRRVVRAFGALGPDAENPLSVHTAAVIRVLGVGDEAATALVTLACEGILLEDYLEPYRAPTVAREPIDGEPQHEDYGRIVFGDQNRWLAGKDQFMIIDRGSDDGVRSGQRFTVYRDKQTGKGFLVEIGEVEAVSVRPDSSTVQVRRAIDAIMRDDLVAIRR
jgi:hypothetical protein